MFIKGPNFDTVYKTIKKKQEERKDEKEYFLLLKKDKNGDMVVYDEDNPVDVIPQVYDFSGMFISVDKYRLRLCEEGYLLVRYVDFHAHSAYSILDGMSTLDEIVESTEWCSALTDHGNMFGFYKFNNKMAEVGKKAILGFEAYVQRKRQDHPKGRILRGHVVILIKNEAGYRNAIKLTSLGYIKGQKTKKTVRPAITYDDLFKHSEGLIVTSACLGGDIPRCIAEDRVDEAYEIAKEMKEVFKDDFYIEIQRHGIQEEVMVNAGLMKLAKDLGIKVVAGVDSHYRNKSDSYYQDILLAGNRQTTILDPNRWRFEGDRYYRMSSKEMVELYKDIPEVLDNTLEIAEKIEFQLNHKGYHLPDFEVPEEFHISDDEKINQYEYMKHLCRKGMDRLGFTGLEEYENQLAFELSVIEKMGYSAYFLIVWDFIDFAKRNGILVGPGRGSACGLNGGSR